MLNIECNGGHWPAGIRTRDGKLWFPTQDGVAIIDPEQVPINRTPPPVIIESFLIQHKPVPFDKPVRLTRHRPASKYNTRRSASRIPSAFSSNTSLRAWTRAGSTLVRAAPHIIRISRLAITALRLSQQTVMECGTCGAPSFWSQYFPRFTGPGGLSVSSLSHARQR